MRGIVLKKTKQKIGVFAYNFKHWKTQATIQNLIMAGMKPDVILAADPVDLSFYKSKIRVVPKDLFLWHPKDLAEKYDIPYYVVKHNSEETRQIVTDYDLDIGVIAGARILKPIAFECFKVGIINMHPGILPDNRGLDNLKWAIIKDMPQGVTAHLIDSKIDKGLLLERETIRIYSDDTLIDLMIRIQNLEQNLMISSIEKLDNISKTDLEHLGEGYYHKSVPEDVEKDLNKFFTNYKKKRSI
jgi:methionyl-tRNA formyltransferase